MLRKILFKPLSCFPKHVQRNNYAVSWKKIKQKIFERQKYYNDYEMRSGSVRVDHEKFKIYITPQSPEIIRTGQMRYQIVQSQQNFNLTFLENIDFMGRDFSWNNRKNIGIDFRDVLKMDKMAQGNPVVLKKSYVNTYNDKTTKTVKELKIQRLADSNVKFSLSIQSDDDGDKWIGTYELNFNDFIFFINGAKKNIYYVSGLKTMIELQKRQIFRQMDKRVLKDQEIPLKTEVNYEADRENLITEMSEYEKVEEKSKQKKTTNLKQKKIRTKTVQH